MNLMANSGAGGTITQIADNDVNTLVLVPAPTNAATDPVDGLLTITADPIPSVSLAVNNASIQEAAGVATYTATLSSASTSAVTVDLAFTGTATLTNDYTRSGTQIVIPAGSLTGSITVTAVQDALDEADETVIVSISGVTNGTVGSTSQATTTILDDDPAPTVNLSVNNANIAEAAGVATFTPTLSAVSGQAVTIDWAFLVPPH